MVRVRVAVAARKIVVTITCVSLGMSGAAAQTWVGATSDFEAAGNWSPATVPDVGSTATFAGTGVTTVNIAADRELDAISFTAAAPSFTITNTANLVFGGAGLQVGSPTAQTLVTTGSGGLSFTGSGSAGTARLTVSGSSVVAAFRDTATAGSATITVQNGGTVQFLESGTAGSAHITLTDSDVTFFASSSALSATIVATAAGGQGITFANNSTAGSSTLTVNGGAFLSFQDSGGAASATITNNNAIVEFQQTSAAGSSTIITNSGGTTRFFDTGGGGNARFITNASGTFNISSLSSTGTTAGSIEGAGNHVLGGKTLTVGSNNLSTEVSGLISGSGGALVKVGSGTLTLSGANTYTGGTTLNAGAISVAVNANLGDAAGGLTFGGGALQTTGTFTMSRGTTLNADGGTFDTASGTTLTQNGDIGGSGGLSKVGAGTLVLGGSNSYSGGTSVIGGTLSVGSNAKLGAASGGVTLDGGTLQATVGFTSSRGLTIGSSGGTLQAEAFDALTWNGVIGGAGGLTVKGTVVLGGSNTYAGGTSVINGILKVSTDANLGAASGSVTLANGTLYTTVNVTSSRSLTLGTGDGTFQVDAAGATLTLNGAIGGAGSLYAFGAGTLALGGSNSYSGSTNVQEGATLAISSDANLGNLGGLVASQLFITGGTLRATTSFTGTRFTSITGNGTFLVDPGQTLTWSGSISGSGTLVKAGDGRLVLTGSNFYTGGTRVTAGVLEVTADAQLGNPSGDLELADGRLVITESFVSNRDVVLGGIGGIFQIGGFPGTALGLNGKISGTGALIKAGPGTLSLGGNSSYSGGTSVTGGTLSIGSDANLGSADGQVFLSDSTLQATGSFTSNRLTAIAGTSTFDIDSTVSWNGVISGGGALVKSGGGALVLGGANTYTGGTTVTGGWLQGTTTSLQGNIVNNGLVIFDQTSDGTYGGVLSGVGNLTKSGSGTVTLSGANSYTGITTLSGGTLAVSADNNLGNGGALAFAGGTLGLLSSFNLASNRVITLFGTGNTVDTNGFDTTIAQGMADDLQIGALVKAGAGTLTLAGANTYSAGTVVNAGILRLGSGGALRPGGALTINGGTFDLNGNNQTVGALAGTGGIIALGAGTLTAGDASNTTFAGLIGGAGSLVKQGAGTLILNGANTYSGGTVVNAGTLQLGSGGSLSSAGALTVNGGTFDLNGNNQTIGALSMTGGTLLLSAATLTVGGLYASAPGSTNVVVVNAAGQSGQIKAGSAALLGGTVAVQPQAGTYTRTTIYTLVGTTGAVNGSYSAATSSNARLVPTLSYSGNAVTLSLLNLDAIYNNPSFTPNQNAVANVLNQANAGATGDFANVLNALSNLGAASLAKVLDAISGQVYAGFGTLGVQTLQTFMESFQLQAGGGQSSGAAVQGRTYTMLAEACDVACDTVSPARWGAWGGGVGAFGTLAGDANSRGLIYNLGGFAAGLDRGFGNGFKAGFATGFSAASLYPQGVPGNGTSNTLQFALYGEYAEGPVYLDALAGYAHADNRMSRPLIIPGLPYRVAQGYTTANQFFGQFEAGYRVDVAPRFGGFVTPFARLQGSTSTQNGFSESGADSLNLTVAQQTTNSLRTVVGAQVGAAIDAGWHGKLNLVFRAGWSHEYADLTRPVTSAFAGAPALTFTTQGAIAPRDGVVLGLGANTSISQGTSLYFRYDGDLAGGNTNHALSAGLRFVW